MIVDIRAEQGAIEEAEIANRSAADAEALRVLNASGDAACRAYLTNWSVTNADAIVEGWWRFSDRLFAKYANGMVSAFANGTTTNPGYSSTWYGANDYQYGPRVYDMAGLLKIPGLPYLNRTITAVPGEELEAIREAR
jgi:hypothetical protein